MNLAEDKLVDAEALFLELRMRAGNQRLTEYKPLLHAQRRACLALKRVLEEGHNIIDPQPERVHTWLKENELGFCFRVEYQLPTQVDIVNGMTVRRWDSESICLDYQLTIFDLLDDAQNAE